MKAIQKKNYVVAIIVLIVFSFNLTATTDSLNEGIFYLNKAKKAKALQMNQTDITEYLNKAYFFFKESDHSKAKFLQIYVGQMIGMNNEIGKNAEKIVRENRKEYINLIAGINCLSNDEKKVLKNFILAVEEKIPFLENIGLKKEVIFPYQGEKPEFHFNLNQAAKVSLRIENDLESTDDFQKGENVVGFYWKEAFFNKKSVCELNSLNDFTNESIAGAFNFGVKMLDWKDALFNKKSFRWELNSLNDFAGDSKAGTVIFDVKMPDLLSFSNNTFEIKDKKFKDKQKLVEKFDPIYLWGVALGGSLVLLGSQGKDISAYKVAVFGGIIGIVSLIGFLASPKKSYVDHKENIEFNKKLNQQIEEMKKEIMIKMELENS